jgi:carboxylate-amine ligase
MNHHRFRGNARPSLGVELELQLVDSRSMALTGAIDEVLAGVPAEYRGSIKPEFYGCCVEINTGVCRDVDEIERDLGAKLATTARIARSRDVLLAWGGTHPFSHWRDQPVVPTPRYRELAGLFGETLCRQLTFGLHIHVGVEDGDTAVRVCNRIAGHLPALLALSANSPFWCGRSTGLHAHRVEVMGASPTGGLPPRLEGWGDYVRLVDRLTVSGLIQSPKELWWDVRPSPDHGTVEVRMCDMPPDLPSVLGLTALTQCLVVELARGDDSDPGLDECGLMMVRQNRWRAARFGLEAGLVDPRTGLRSSAREIIKDLTMRLDETAEDLGCARQLGQVRAMADGPGGAARQLAVFERTGDLTAVARHMTGWHTPEPGPGVAGPAAGNVAWAITPGAPLPIAVG